MNLKKTILTKSLMVSTLLLGLITPIFCSTAMAMEGSSSMIDTKVHIHQRKSFTW